MVSANPHRLVPCGQPPARKETRSGDHHAARTVLLSLLLLGVAAGDVIAQPTSPSGHFRYGMPEIGVVRTNQEFTVLYDTVYHLPLCVAYRVDKDVRDAPQVRRILEFHRDTNTPRLPEAALLDSCDYEDSGFERGQMAPSGTMRQGGWTGAYQSFAMTNVAPQTMELNQGLWACLEELVRAWAAEMESLWVVTGPILANPFDEASRHIAPIPFINDQDQRRDQAWQRFIPGQLHQYIAIPNAFYKIILVPGEQKPDTLTDEEQPRPVPPKTPPSLLGFVIPQDVKRVGNLRVARAELPQYVASVDHIERLTGIDFYPTLPWEDLEASTPSREELKSKWKLGTWRD